MAASTGTPAGRYSRPSLQAPNEPAHAAPRAHPLANPRTRFAVGVVIALVVGFIPAHLVSAMRERSAYDAIDVKVMSVQAAADTPDTYANLDAFRAEQLARKRSERTNIALIALAIWVLVGGGTLWAWHNRMPWDKLDSPHS